MCNYCSIALSPEEIKCVALESSKRKDGALDTCLATANAHVPGREGHKARPERTKGGHEEDAFYFIHATGTGREEWLLSDTGTVPPVLTCFQPPKGRVTALLNMSSYTFKGRVGVGIGYIILKDANKHVPDGIDGSVGHIAIDAETARDIRPDNVNNAPR